MATNTEHKNILLGVTGSIASFKSLLLVSLLRAEGYKVKVILSKSAQAFITKLSFDAMLGGCHTYTEEEFFSDPLLHINLARWANMLVVAPCSANTMAKMAHGVADNLLLNIYLALKPEVQVAVAPALNPFMWLHQATQTNVRVLKGRGVNFFGPIEGTTCCQEEGVGRLIEPSLILELIRSSLTEPWLKGKKVVVSAGPTIEPIDEVRFISNHSSGKMGYSMAKVAVAWGADVTLITGPTELPPPVSCEVVRVKSARDMQQALHRHALGADFLIMSAAVADQTPKQSAVGKQAKTDLPSKLELQPVPDLLKEVATGNERPRCCVGFTIGEEGNLTQMAHAKLYGKNLDVMVANSLGEHTGFHSSTNAARVFVNKALANGSARPGQPGEADYKSGRSGDVLSDGTKVLELPLQPKESLAYDIWRILLEFVKV